MEIIQWKGIFRDGTDIVHDGSIPPYAMVACCNRWDVIEDLCIERDIRSQKM
jgi:hypothetical protein